jgi:hypothetical protein
MRLDTALNVINDALFEMGLIGTAFANPFMSTDANAVSMRYLLKALGEELVRLRPWSHLEKTYTFSTVNGTGDYALPTDFMSMSASTHWNRSTTVPLAGPLSGPGWQVLKSASVLNPTSYFFRVYGNRLYLHPVPSSAETIAYEYSSAYWVQPSGQSTPTAEAPSANADTLWFDRHLLIRGLKLKWHELKGFSTDVSRVDYERALSATMGGDGARPELHLAQQATRRTPRLPDTNWGV